MIYYRATLLVATLALLSAGPGVAHAEGNFNFFAGLRQLDKADWEPIEQPYQLGIEFDIQQPDWPVGLVMSSMFARDSDRKGGASVRADLFDFGVGARLTPKPTPRIRPFVEGGLAFVRAQIEADSDESGAKTTVSDDDAAVGIWVGLGALFRPSKEFNLGILIRWSTAKVTLFDESADAGGLQYGLLGGVAF